VDGRGMSVGWSLPQPQAARATIQSVVVLGAFHASPDVRMALADRIH